MATEAATAATPRAAAVIPAAGRARRFGSGENKIWTKIAGRTVLERTLAAFDRHPAIACIVLAAGAEEVERVRVTAAAFPKVMAVVVGGETRADSVRAGLDALPTEIETVLVHDAARPLLSSELIDRVLAGVTAVGAAVPGLPLSDTVKRTDSKGIVRETISRTAVVEGETLSGLTAVQTPQGAKVSLLRDAYAAYDFSLREPTDEASLLEAFLAPIVVVPGDPINIKITRQEDVALAERLLEAQRAEAHAKAQSQEEESSGQSSVAGGQKDRAVSLYPLQSDGTPSPISFPDPLPAREREEEFRSANAARLSAGQLIPEFRTGFGYDVHAFASPEAGRRLFLGGVEIPHDRGLEGHSDSDVVLHAICDALLGAASLGDIGILFPNTDPAYKGISSLRLLGIVGERLGAAGWEPVNIDVAVVAEAPKLMPHRPAMQRGIAECLGIEADRVSVKATTSEKMGFVGRREGMACWAIATVRSRTI